LNDGIRRAKLELNATGVESIKEKKRGRRKKERQGEMRRREGRTGKDEEK
jgi:hypothetical protein